MEQLEIVDTFIDYMENIKWYTKDGPAPFKSRSAPGPRYWNNMLDFPKGATLTINAVKQLHRDLRTNYNMKYLMTSKVDQNPLENEFGCLRGSNGNDF